MTSLAALHRQEIQKREKCLMNHPVFKRIQDSCREFVRAEVQDHKLEWLHRRGAWDSDEVKAEDLSSLLDRSRSTGVEILRGVSLFSDLSIEQLRGRQRNRRVAQARQLCCYIIHKRTVLSMPEIAKILNRADHSTVVHAVKVTEERLGRNPTLAALHDDIVAWLEL